MNIRVLALSTALLFTTGAFAQHNAAATPPATQNSMSSTQNRNANNSTAPPLNSTPETKPMAYQPSPAQSGGGWSWGWIGLFGLFGLLGMGGGKGRKRDGVVTTNIPR